MKNLIISTLYFAFVATLAVFSLSTVIHAQDGLVFAKEGTSTTVGIDFSQPVCVYLKNAYRPVTKSAVAAVAAAGTKTCTDKSEAVLYAQTGKLFTKLNRKKLGDVMYNKIKLAYYNSLK